MKKHNGFDFGDFEITYREILASISIIAVMLLLGFVISGKISLKSDKLVEEQISVYEENNKKKAKTGNPDRGRMCAGHYSDTPGSAGC